MGARLGQHFLSDPAILGRIADAALLDGDDVVLEIGPGRGTLTRVLAERAGKVIAIEVDDELAAALAQRFAGSNVTVVRGDALEVPWPQVSKVCGNIPYQITSPLIERALTPPRPRLVVLLIQREVADRLAAPPGSKTYGALSAGVQLVADVERLFTVRPGAFRPPPRVASAVVRLAPRRQPLTRDEEEERRVRRLIRAVFQRRRQQLQRVLRETWRLTPEAAAGALAAAGIEAAARPEELSPDRFVALARAVAAA